MWFSFVFTAFVAAAAGQTATRPEKASVEGQVVNAATGEPLKKAHVTLRPADIRRSGGYAAVTDPGGNFAFRDVEKGSYRLLVERTGFVRAEYGGRSTPGRGGAGGSFPVDSGQKITGLTMKMTPQAVIAGRVLDDEGDPVAGVQVSVLRYAYVRGKRQLTPSGGGATDDQGEYRIHSLQPGKYYVSATFRAMSPFGRPGPSDGPQSPDDNYAPTYYPRTVDVAAAVALDAVPGAVLRNIDIMLTRVRTVQVSGRIVDPTGGGGRNVMVSAFPRDNPGGLFAGQRPHAEVRDGRFVLRGVRPGGYIISAERWERDRRFTARVPVEVGDAPLEDVVLTMQPSLEVSGTVKVEGSNEIRTSGVTVYLQPRTDMGMMGASGGRVKDDGRFTMSNAGPDLYSVALMGMPENCYLKAVRYGDEDALTNGLNLARGPAPLEITLSASAGSVEAVVLDARQQPAAGAVVAAIPEGPRAELSQFTRSGVADTYGRVTLKGLAPGEYKLYAWEEIEANSWQDPDVLKTYERFGESLSIRENGRESKQLTAIAAGAGEGK